MALLAGLTGCGGGDPRAAAPRDVCGAKVGQLGGPTTRLMYRSAAAVVADVPVLCERLRALKIAHQVRGTGRDRLVVEVRSSDLAAAKSAARPGRLSFYDWEANVVGPAGKPAPGNRKVTGGPSAGQTGGLALYDAVLRASKRAKALQPDNGRKGSVFYAVDPEARKVFGSGDSVAADTRAGALAAVPAARRAAAKVREVKANTMVVRAEQQAGLPAKTDEWFVLVDDVAVSGTEIENPAQRFDNGAGGTGEPIVTFEFSAAGALAFRTLTRELARRGARSVGLAAGRTPADANQHFAIVLDDELVSVPYIDFRANPDGIEGAPGSQIQGGFTIASAKALVSTLRSGALPVALELVATAPAGSP